jgi:hypothetical protein
MRLAPAAWDSGFAGYRPRPGMSASVSLFVSKVGVFAM